MSLALDEPTPLVAEEMAALTGKMRGSGTALCHLPQNTHGKAPWLKVGVQVAWPGIKLCQVGEKKDYAHIVTIDEK